MRDLIEIGRGGALETDRDTLRIHGGDPVRFGVINNDGELFWAIGASIVEASRKDVDVDGRRKYIWHRQGLRGQFECPSHLKG